MTEKTRLFPSCRIECTVTKLGENVSISVQIAGTKNTHFNIEDTRQFDVESLATEATFDTETDQCVLSIRQFLRYSKDDWQPTPVMHSSMRSSDRPSSHANDLNQDLF